MYTSKRACCKMSRHKTLLMEKCNHEIKKILRTDIILQHQNPAFRTPPDKYFENQKPLFQLRLLPEPKGNIFNSELETCLQTWIMIENHESLSWLHFVSFRLNQNITSWTKRMKKIQFTLKFTQWFSNNFIHDRWANLHIFYKWIILFSRLLKVQ